MFACRVLGHRYGFRNEGPVLVWECERGCGAQGEKTYATADEARRYAVAFDHRATDDIGRRAPLLGMFPLRFWRWAQNTPRRRAPLASSRGPRKSREQRRSNDR